MHPRRYNLLPGQPDEALARQMCQFGVGRRGEGLLPRRRVADELGKIRIDLQATIAKWLCLAPARSNREARESERNR
jgi:hypothetical protein